MAKIPEGGVPKGIPEGGIPEGARVGRALGRRWRRALGPGHSRRVVAVESCCVQSGFGCAGSVPGREVSVPGRERSGRAAGGVGRRARPRERRSGPNRQRSTPRGTRAPVRRDQQVTHTHINKALTLAHAQIILYTSTQQEQHNAHTTRTTPQTTTRRVKPKSPAIDSARESRSCEDKTRKR